jgi:hypothetical protein
MSWKTNTLKPIAWKYPDPREKGRWVYCERDFDRLRGKLRRVVSYQCVDCGTVVIEGHRDLHGLGYGEVFFDLGTNEPLCEDCFHAEENLWVCTKCGTKSSKVEERYSFGIYAGRLCIPCCRSFRDHCGVDGGRDATMLAIILPKQKKLDGEEA